MTILTRDFRIGLAKILSLIFKDRWKWLDVFWTILNKFILIHISLTSQSHFFIQINSDRGLHILILCNVLNNHFLAQILTDSTGKPFNLIWGFRAKILSIKERPLINQKFFKKYNQNAQIDSWQRVWPNRQSLTDCKYCFLYSLLLRQEELGHLCLTPSSSIMVFKELASSTPRCLSLV